MRALVHRLLCIGTLFGLLNSTVPTSAYAESAHNALPQTTTVDDALSVLKQTNSLGAAMVDVANGFRNGGKIVFDFGFTVVGPEGWGATSPDAKYFKDSNTGQGTIYLSESLASLPPQFAAKVLANELVNFMNLSDIFPGRTFDASDANLPAGLSNTMRFTSGLSPGVLCGRRLTRIVSPLSKST